ncbi:uncharacterized protein LOC129968858 [Argiope bruennichi]|uniref:uncharacterized protein LOC129968858 n=1 Tax=Argiope bruennichi TaxID=94029 RepID=UPI0024950E3A|nr:uncharacterized protein LOC129968858 [Argiope bruennichi]
MTATFLPSLKHMTLAKIAITICKEPEISCSIYELDYLWDKNIREGRWKRLMEKAEEKVSKLHIPPRLQQNILAVIKPISLEMAKFKHDHLYFLGNRFDFQRCRLFWTHEGILDRQKTIQVLIRDEHICIINRFILAICYFLETDAKNMLKHIDFSDFDLTNEQIFWISFARKYSNWSEIALQFGYYLVSDPALNCHLNSFYLRCFLDRLTPYNKKLCIENTVKKTYRDHDNFRFCISQLNEEQRESVFKENPLRLLRFLLDWPYQSLFSEAAEQMWKYLRGREFRYLLYFIIFNRIVADWYDFDYVNLLKDFWQQSPEHLKDYIERDSIYEPVQMVIAHDCTKPLPMKEIILTSFHVAPPNGRIPVRECDLFPIH